MDRDYTRRLSHAPPTLPADLVQGIGNLPQRAAAHRVHHHREHVLVADHRLPESRQAGLQLTGIASLEDDQAGELRLRLRPGRVRQLDLAGHAALAAINGDAHRQPPLDRKRTEARLALDSTLLQGVPRLGSAYFQSTLLCLDDSGSIPIHIAYRQSGSHQMRDRGEHEVRHRIHTLRRGT